MKRLIISAVLFNFMLLGYAQADCFKKTELQDQIVKMIGPTWLEFDVKGEKFANMVSVFPVKYRSQVKDATYASILIPGNDVNSMLIIWLKGDGVTCNYTMVSDKKLFDNILNTLQTNMKEYSI